MAIEGLDASLPVETGAFHPLIPEAREDGLTLDTALRTAEGSNGERRALDREICGTH